MAIYIERSEAGDLENLSPAVLAFVIQEHKKMLGRLNTLDDAYMARNLPKPREADEISVVADYPRYIVETLTGYYLGDPIKYMADDEHSDGLDVIQGQEVYFNKQGRLKTVPREGIQIKPDIDIKPILDCYEYQTISDVDSEIGRQIGIFGETYELIYASEDARPKSCVCDPRTCVMVRDDSVDGRKLFFLRYKAVMGINGNKYWKAYVYTDKTETVYTTSDLNAYDFVKVDVFPHFFGEVPVVEYTNNHRRLGDFETQLTLINAYNILLSDRSVDKSRFIESVLALYGADLTEEMVEGLQKYGIIAGLPVDSRLEYVQKMLNEEGVQVLANCFKDEILRQSMVVDLSDVTFTNSSGLALKLRLLSMSMLVRSKIRSVEKGIKKRFEIYNHYLRVQGVMGYVYKNDITPIFTLSLPIDEQSIAQVVKTLEGIVDQEALLSLLWFVKDPKETAEKVNKEKAANQKAYLDVFGITANNKENIGNETEPSSAPGDVISAWTV